MILIYILLTVYIAAVNFYSFQLLRTQREEWDEEGSKQDGKLFLAAILGGAAAIYVSMFVMRFRLSNLLLMIAMPVLTVLNVYCFFLAYRGVYLFL